jgi:acyl transferase domain-containing protein/phosphopantetheinyl transferase
MTNDRQPAADIAIIGMSAMYAKSANVEEFWQNILDGVDQVHEASASWTDCYYDPASTDVCRIYTRKGGFLGDHVEFDPTEFGIMPNAIHTADVDHFIGLKLARDALADAGYLDRPFDRKNTGVILGRSTTLGRGYSTVAQLVHIDQTLEVLRQVNPDLTPEALSQIRSKLKEGLPVFNAEVAPSLVPNVVTGRIANRLDLMGPNYVADGACASTLLAVELAINELRSGRCNMVLTGGAQGSMPPEVYMFFCQLNALSRSNVRPFDAGANGTLLGEGLGIFVLKRLADAERDGDRIYAVIKGVGSSSDGRALGLLAPRVEGQMAALERAYGDTGIDPDTVTLIEAHGTGLPVGDKTEIQTLTQMYGQRGSDLPKRALGSVKSMIGHCIPGAGAASIVKVALALHDKVLPPTICDTVNPNLGIEQSSVYVNNTTRPWIHGATDHPRRAVINSFGFGGVNAHAILEEYRPKNGEPRKVMHRKWPSELLLFAAPDRAGLSARLKEVRAALNANADASLADVAHALAASADGAHRLAVVCTGKDDLAAKLDQAAAALEDGGKPRLSPRAGIHYCEAIAAAERGGTAFLFPGEGGQHEHMMADLCLHLPEVRAWFDRLDEALMGLAPIAPSQVIFPPPTSLSAEERQRIDRTLLSLEIGSAAVFASSMAMYDLLSALRVHSDCMIGHSTGEFSALVASGVIRHAGERDYKDGAARFYLAHRELLKTRRVPAGVLLTVGAVDRAVLGQIVAGSGGKIHVALENCPNQTVLFGERDDIDPVAARLKEQGAICVPLPFERGYHTPLIAEADPILRALYDSLDIGPARTPLYSCTTAELFPAEPAAIRELATQQIYSPVRFRQAIENLYANGVRTFIEVGPGANLTGFVRDTLQRRPHLAVPSNMAGKSSITQLQQLLAQLYVRGVDIDAAPLFAHRHLRQVSLTPSTGTTAARKKRPQILETLNPRSRLDKAFVDDICARVAPRPVTRDEVTASAAAPASQATNGATVPPLASPAPAPASDARPVDPRVAGMRAHFDLMRSFLDSQSRIMARLGAATPAPGSAAANGHVPAPVAAAPDQGKYALLGRVVEQTAARLVCERQFVLTEERFLRDHTVGCRPSARDPNLLALPVVPCSVSMEILAEAAMRLAGAGKRVVRVHGVRAYRWLAIDQSDIAIRVTADLIGPDPDGEGTEIRARIFELGKDEEKGREFLAVEGKIVLSSAYAPVPPPRPLVLTGERPAHYTREMFYGDPRPGEERYTPLYHGPTFQAVTSLRRWGAEGIEGELRILPTDGFCTGAARPSFETDAILLDAASHLVPFWKAERFGVDPSSFPFAVQDYRQYAPPPEPGQRIVCRAWIKIVGANGESAGFDLLDRDGNVLDRRSADGLVEFPTAVAYDRCRIYPADAYIEAHIDFIDENERLIVRLTGWRDRYMEPPRRCFGCCLRPQTEWLSEPWMQAETNRICRRIDNWWIGYLERSFGIWKRALAHLTLARRERDFWYALPKNGPRRTEWLLGRIAAKEAIRQWALERHRLQVAPADIEILPGPLGQPVVASAVLADVGLFPDVSISHSKGTIVAAVSEPGTRIGIDFARMEDVRSTDLLRKAFLTEELALLDRKANGNASAAVLHFWCAKEAASKAHGQGLGGEPRNWVVDQYEPEDGQVTVNRDGRSYRVRVWQMKDEVLAVC